jgi:hypothetical protein
MIRETIIATSDSYTIYFPKEWIGKTVSVIYDEEEQLIRREEKTDSFNASDIYKDVRVDLSQFKFDRNEANSCE